MNKFKDTNISVNLWKIINRKSQRARWGKKKKDNHGPWSSSDSWPIERDMNMDKMEMDST